MIVKTDGWFAAVVQCVSSIHVLYWLCWWPPGTGHTRGEPPVAGVTEPCCHCGCQESTGGATQTGTLSTLSTHYLHTIYNKHYTICIIYTIFAISCNSYTLSAHGTVGGVLKMTAHVQLHDDFPTNIGMSLYLSLFMCLWMWQLPVRHGTVYTRELKRSSQRFQIKEKFKNLLRHFAKQVLTQ